MDQVFYFYGLHRAWVNVPDDNVPALGLFKKLGFIHEETRPLCKRRDGTTLNACILSMNAVDFRARESRGSPGRQTTTVVTVTGLPGSGSEIVGEEIARLTGRRFIDDEIPTRMCQILGRTPGELKAIEESCLSVWSRLLRAYLAPYEHHGFAAGGIGYDWVAAWPWPAVDELEQEGYLTKERYLYDLRQVVSEFALEGDVVLHGHGSHLFVPSRVPAINVFVTASDSQRIDRVVKKEMMGSKEAQRALKRADRDSCSIFKHLFGSNLLDTRQYELVLNLERLTSEAAARMVVGALDTAGPSLDSPRSGSQT